MTDWLSFGAWGVLTLLGGAGLYFFLDRLAFARRDIPVLGALLGWGALVLGAHLASLYQSLNDGWIYTACCVAGLLFLLVVTRLCVSTTTALICPSLPSYQAFPLRRFFLVLLSVTLGIVFLASLFVAVSSYPDNADTVIYRFSRVFWYVSHGSFLHPFDAVDKRLTFYPLDGVALYVPFVVFGLPGVFFNFPSLALWSLAGYTAYRFARLWGADRCVALAVTTLLVTTPNILVQATSTNDEILAAAALLMGLYVAVRAFVTGQRAYLLCATMGLALSMGTKLHIVFLLPVLLVLTFLLARHLRQRPHDFGVWSSFVGLPVAVACGLVFALLFFPFLGWNYLSSGCLYFLNDFAPSVFNLSANPQGWMQNLIIYFAQMILSPIADFNILGNFAERTQFNAALNAMTNPLIMPFIDSTSSFYHLAYRFTGVVLFTSVYFVEFSLWAGFVWALWPLQFTLIRSQAKEPFLRSFLLLAAATPLLWLLFWSVTTLYMEGTATYFSFYLTLAAPALAVLFFRSETAWKNRLRWALLGLVFLSNLVITANIFYHSGFRSVPMILKADRWPFDWMHMDQEIISEIQRAHFIRVLMTHEKIPYFSFMHYNPRAVYLDPQKPPENPADVLQLIPVSGLASLGFMPLKIENKKTLGATYLGLMRGIGREALFAVGNGVEMRHPLQSDFIIMRMRLEQEGQGARITSDPFPVGFDPKDQLDFRFEIKTKEGSVALRDWSTDVHFSASLDEAPSERAYALHITVRNTADHRIVAERAYPLFGAGQWLPDIPIE